MRLLLIEDDEDAGQTISKALSQDNHQVELARDGEAGLKQALAETYDLAILDIRLPGKDGWEIHKEVRQAGKATPILILTANGAFENKVKGLDLGADDYLVKPFDLSEFLVRVRALLSRKPVPEDPVMRIDTLEIDTRSRTVRRGEEFVRVTAKEYSLLECLARRAGTMMSRDEISRRVWNEPYDPRSNLIEEYIKRIRRKIGVGNHKPLIYARRGEGYILTAEEFS